MDGKVWIISGCLTLIQGWLETQIRGLWASRVKLHCGELDKYKGPRGKDTEVFRLGPVIIVIRTEECLVTLAARRLQGTMGVLEVAVVVDGPRTVGTVRVATTTAVAKQPVVRIDLVVEQGLEEVLVVEVDPVEGARLAEMVPAAVRDVLRDQETMMMITG